MDKFHGDICVENILVDMRKKSAHFIRLNSKQSQTISTITNSSITKATDIYELGAVIYLILSGGSIIHRDRDLAVRNCLYFIFLFEIVKINKNLLLYFIINQ